jgi:hypothetical protein
MIDWWPTAGDSTVRALATSSTSELLKGLRRAYEDFDTGEGKAWGGTAPPR